MQRAVHVTAVACLTLLVSVPPRGAAQSAPEPALRVSGYELLARQRVGRVSFDYTYRVSVVNDADQNYDALTVVFDSTTPGAEIVDGRVAIAALPAGSTGASTDTITVRVDRRFPFDPALLEYRFAFGDVEYTAAAAPAVTVPIGAAGGEFGYTTPDGVSYTIAFRPGALIDEEVAITLTDVIGIDGIPPGGFVSALDLGPDGTRFWLPPVFTVDLSAVAPPGEIVLPVITATDGDRNRLLFNFARNADGSIVPNAYQVVVPHFSVFSVESIQGDEFVCGTSEASKVCIPLELAGGRIGGGDGDLGPDHGNPVAREAKEAVAGVLAEVADRQSEGAPAAFTAEESERMADALGQWGESIEERIRAGAGDGFGGDPELKNEVVRDALSFSAACQILPVECEEKGLEQASRAAETFERFVLDQCSAEGDVSFTAEDVLQNVALIETLGGESDVNIGDGSSPPQICPLPDFSGGYTFSSSGSYTCPDPEDNDSYSASGGLSLQGSTRRTGADRADVSLSGGGNNVSLSVSFSLTLDSLGRVTSASAGSVSGTASAGGAVGRFSGGGAVSAPGGNRFALSGSLTGSDNVGCSGGGSLSIN